MIVKVKKWGNSQGIILPKYILNSIGVTDEDVELSLEINNDKEIVIKKAKEPLTIDKLFEGFDYKKYWADWDREHHNQSKEENLGNPVGKEISI